MRASFVDTLLKKALEDKKIMLLTGDLGFGVLREYCEKVPQQSVCTGEEDATFGRSRLL